jgi:hypothetical protein
MHLRSLLVEVEKTSDTIGNTLGEISHNYACMSTKKSQKNLKL